MKKTTAAFLTLSLILALRVFPVSAHPADVYSHAIHVTLSQAGVSIRWEITPGPLLVSFLWFEADADRDGAVSATEAGKWAEARAALFTATLNHARLPLQLGEVEFPSSLERFQAGAEIITLQLSAVLPQNTGDAYELVLFNGVEVANSLNWYSVRAQDGLTFPTPEQRNNLLSLDILEPAAQAAAQSALLTEWDSNTPALPQQPQGAVTQTPAEQALSGLLPNENNAAQNTLLNLVRSEQVSPVFYIFALGISLILGALHALTPGHGKTVVAAYLVGSRGTPGHAVALGTVVTLTHTGSVLLLGIVTLAASRYILPTSLIPVLEILSGLLIVGLGAYLLQQRFEHWRKTKVNKSARRFSLRPQTPGANKPVGGLQIQAHSHDAHEPHHHGDGRVHSHEMPETITWRSLIALGVSGGLVPCPDAIAILLVALAINRLLLGLTLIVAFSFGLAVVLIVIGLLMVNSRRLFERMNAFDQFVPALPVVSAVVVLVLGLALTASATARAWGEFDSAGAGAGSVQEAQVVYLAGGRDEVKQLFRAGVTGGNPIRLSDAGQDVLEYALAPDAGRLVYVVRTENFDHELWLVDLATLGKSRAVVCERAICSRLAWSPDGTRLVYEFIDAGENAAGFTTLRWLDVATGEVQPVFQEAQLPGSYPRWSPDGTWLGYAAGGDIRLYNLETGENHALAIRLAGPVNWSPDSQKAIYRDVLLQERQFITQVFVYDLASQAVTNVNPDPRYENLSAAWSPDGEWIAAVRRELDVPRGDQIWLMRADGSEARLLTDRVGILHNNLAWSPDGEYLLYDAFDLNAASDEPNLQLLEVATGALTDLGIQGYQASWLP